MTYKEFKEQGYTIEMVEYATVWSEVIINDDEPAGSGSRYDFKMDELETHGVQLYRIVSFGNDDAHDNTEFNDLEELEDYIRLDM